MLVAVLVAEASAQPSPFTVAPTPMVVIGSVDGAVNTQFDRVYGAVRLPEGAIVVGNSGSGELRAFDARGQVLWSAGRQGAGPGEFGSHSSVVPMHIKAGRIIAEDAESRRLNVFSSVGKFERTFKLVPNHAVAWATLRAADGDILLGMSTRDARLGGGAGDVLTSSYSYALFDSLGAQRYALFEASGRQRIVHTYGGVTHYPFIPFAAEPLVTMSGGRVFVMRGDSAVIEVWSTNGQKLANWKWPAQRVAVRDIWSRYTSSALEGASVRDKTLCICMRVG
jgi:hypothetical protein